MKILRIIGVLAIVVALLLGGTASALANGPTNPNAGGGKHSPKSGLFGTVDVEPVNQDDYYIIVLTTDDGDVEVTINNGTKYTMPGVPQPERDLATFVDGLNGRRIAALVEFADETKTAATALRVMLMPNPNNERVHGHRVGVVTAFTEEHDSITIANKKGEETTFEVPPVIKLLPTDTQMDAIVVDETFVTVIYSRDPGTMDFVVKGMVVHPAIPDGWSEGDEEADTLALIASGVQGGDPDPQGDVVGSVTLEADSDNDTIIIIVSLDPDAVAALTDYGVYLEYYDGLPDDGGEWQDWDQVGSLTIQGDGSGLFDGTFVPNISPPPGTYYVQIAVGQGWDFKTKVIELEIE